MRYIYFLLTVLFFLFYTGLSAQEKSDTLVTGDFKEVRIEQFVRELEAQTGFHFYYISNQFDSLKINVSVKEQPLKKVLEQVFVNTSFHFSIDQRKNVFLIKDKTITPDLPVGFFDKTKNRNDTVSNNMADIDLTNDNKAVAASMENKLYEIGTRGAETKTGNATIAGYVRDDQTREPLPGVSIFLEENTGIGVVTDQFGYFSLTLPKGKHTLNIQSRGKKDAIRHVVLYSDGKMDIYLHDQIIALKEVVVSSRKTSNVRSVQLGVDKLNITTIKQVPTVFGEADILRVILNLPGVKSVGEASTGFNVRGGSTDQNLILFNGATIYNPSHFFGFFSAFNPEVVKDVELYKSSIPPKYGGRLSSVLDITSREGNKKDFAGSAGIGPVTSRLNVEGPFSKRDSSNSFVIGARATYADWLLNLLPHQYDKSQASFYDVALHTTHDLNKKNSLYLTAYFSKDHFNLNNDTAYEYGNRNINIQWKHTFNNRLNNLTGVGYDFYQYNINSDANKINAYDLKFDVSQASLRSDFNYYVNTKHTIEFGINSIYYKLHPGSFTPVGSESLVKPDIVAAEQGLESAVYLGDRFNVSPAFSINYAIRYSMYQYLGPQSVSYYAPGVPRDESSRTETKEYGKGDIIKNYGGPEYRLALRYALSPDFSIKAGINSLRQYIHMLSNTTAIAPTDIWKLSDPNIKPQEGEQVSFGFYKNFKSNTIETSVEVYYKRMRHYLDYKSGAILVLNHNIETDVINTRGKAYGIELLIKKIAGKLNGWIGYSYSRTFLKQDDPIAGEVINNGEYYPSNYDKPHDFSFVGNIRLSHRFSVSSNIVYSTGRPITLPFGMYYYSGAQRVLYSDRNAYRIPDNFRIDLSMNIEGNAKVHQRTHNSWTIGVYNLTGRKNPYSVYFISENGVIKGYKLSIFGSIIPFVNFNIRF
jgi:hypothetical protein